MPRSATPRCRKSYASMPHGIDPKAKGEDRLANVTTPQCREGNGRPVYYRARILPCTGVAPPRRLMVGLLSTWQLNLVEPQTPTCRVLSFDR
jgi:hypothetical protein